MLITGAELADGRVRDVRIRDGTIDAVEPTNAGLDADTGERVVDARGRHLLPGAVDVHVHFREPGARATRRRGPRARGGRGRGRRDDGRRPAEHLTPTVDGDAFDEKAALAADSLVDYGINGGVTADWDPESLFERPLFALGEVFLADSTGDMGIALDLFEEALAEAAARDVPVTVHAEDETLFDESALDGDLGGRHAAANADAWSATEPPKRETAAIERAPRRRRRERRAGAYRAHVDAEGIDAVSDTDATCEVTPHHLFLSREDAGRLGTFGRMNPPLRSEERRAAVFERLRDGDVDVVATDHAPHTVAEKRQRLVDAPSGVPGVETLYPLLLESVRKGNLSLERVRDVVAANPASIFEIEGKGRIEPGADADLVVVDLTNPARSRPARSTARPAGRP